jgi:beta-glucosidase
VTLKPGEEKEIAFTLNREALGCYDAEGHWVTRPGRFELVIAPNSASGRMAGFTLE